MAKKKIDDIPVTEPENNIIPPEETADTPEAPADTPAEEPDELDNLLN